LPRKFAAIFILLGLLAACAPQAERISVASAAAALPAEPVWAFETSDIPVDTEFRFGRLANGVRYIVRYNATPKGTAIVRMEIEAGSLDEREDELGFAHFVEHMAFNGSTHVPEGEMVRLLERDGLAFGADTNASTSFERTTYKLDLPRNDPQLLATALMLMRETASELSFSEAAVDRERGVILAELRDRNTYRLKEAMDNTSFQHPNALYPHRFPIGTVESLRSASAEALKEFWTREYLPEHTVLVVIGDFDTALVEAEITRFFASWQDRDAEPQPDGGPIDFQDAGRTAIYLDPALPERITATRDGPWLNEPDTIAQRQEGLLRRIGYAIINRRLARLSRQAEPPFRGAGFGTGDIFEVGRSTRLIVDSPDRKWRTGLTEAVREYRRALEYGFSKAEIAEQIANIRTDVENAAAAAETLSNRMLEAVAWALVHDGSIPSQPQTVFERFEAFAPQITPMRVLEALKREAVALHDPKLRFRGRFPPQGGKQAIRNAWNAAMAAPVERAEEQQPADFSYTDFGPAGEIASDKREAGLGIRTVRFNNGVMLNVKRTDLEKDRIRVRLSIDGGEMLKTRDNPLATEMTPFLPSGGLGRHSRDELQTILAGKTVGSMISASEKSFVSSVETTSRDLDLQLQLLAAFVTDPGYRREGEVEFRHQLNRYFAQLNATPRSALQAGIAAILSDHDPRFSLQNVEDYRRLTFQKLSADISDRLANGAIEIGIVGDVDEERAIELVAQTFGALPERERAFRTYNWQPHRRFTQDRHRRILRHTGPKDQALLQLVWPTRDDSDPVETLKLELLERVVRIELTDTLREALGKAYSPGASSALSRSWKGYGTFSITASVDVSDLSEARTAVLKAVSRFRDNPPSVDLVRRALQPMLEAQRNALKSNAGWLVLVDRAQTEADRIERYLHGEERLKALGPPDIQAGANLYLHPADVLEILVLPEGVNEPEG